MILGKFNFGILLETSVLVLSVPYYKMWFEENTSTSIFVGSSSDTVDEPIYPKS